MSPKWISLFVRIVLALSFLQVALPGGLSDPVLLYAISVVFQATLRLGAFSICLTSMLVRGFSPYSRALRGRSSFQ